MENNAEVILNIQNNYEKLFAAEKKVADYILADPAGAVSIHVSELAELSGVSDASVVRMCKRLGYSGFYQMKLLLSHDLGRNGLPGKGGGDSAETLSDIYSDIMRNLSFSLSNIDKDAFDRCVKRVAQAENIYVVAEGNSIPIAMSLSYRLGRIGVKSYNNVTPEAYLNSINLGGENDAVIGVSHSGSTAVVVAAFDLARQRGMTTIAITDLKRSPLGNNADIVLSAGFSSETPPDAPEFHSHIYIEAMIDSLLRHVAGEKKDRKSPDDIDILMSSRML